MAITSYSPLKEGWNGVGLSFVQLNRIWKLFKKNEILEKFGFLLLSFGLMPSNHSKSFQDNVWNQYELV